MDAGDGSGHRQRFAEVDLSLTGVKTVGIGENFGVFRFRPIWPKIAKIRFWGFWAGRGSRAAGERCPACLNPFCFLKEKAGGVTGSRSTLLGLPGI
ncbi:hypothetical protein CRG98_008548 [Punica granatum]|uniref:Uncharacterized protein n=1 Tax=Punica granatum TaxID=22663 RepID=A0A2I0KS25_PUNGR|nr:hypothetical protein CRG98_008548 [Punica granatum]